MPARPRYVFRQLTRLVRGLLIRIGSQTNEPNPFIPGRFGSRDDAELNGENDQSAWTKRLEFIRSQIVHTFNPTVLPISTHEIVAFARVFGIKDQLQIMGRILGAENEPAVSPRAALDERPVIQGLWAAIIRLA
jgi:hypothetical protein